jgi:peptide/nickel transport system permease protein
MKTLRLLMHNKVGFAGFLGVLFFLFLAFVAPLFIPLDTETRVDQIYQLPSAEHILGTDFQGRDIFSLIVHGGRDVMVVAFLTGLISTTIAVILGSLSALLGGWVDSLIMAVTDVWLAIPQLPLLAVVATMIKLDSVVLTAVVLAALAWPSLTRAIRSQVLSLRQREYVQAAQLLDLGNRHIISSELLPNMMSYIAINLVFAMTGAVYSQVLLVFLGLVTLSNNWGVIINLAWTRGAIFSSMAFMNILAPVLALALFQLSLVSFTRSLEEIFNPRLRTSV